jgi:type I restriction enzyme S subunit
MTDEVRVGDVLDLQRRRVLPEQGESYREIGLRSFGKGVFHKKPTTASELGTKKVFRIEPGDFLISNVFAWEGAVAVASEGERGLIGSHRFMTWTPKRPGEVDVDYLRHYFGSDAGLAQLRRASPGSAGRNRTLGIAAFENLVVPLPDPPEQRQIAVSLDRLDNHLTSLTTGNASGRQALTLMPRVLGQQLDSFNWPTVPVSDLCAVVSDVVQPKDDVGAATEFVGLEFLQGHTGQRIGSGPTTNRTGRKLRFRPGDVLYGYLRPYQNKVWAADRPGLCSVEQYVLRSKESSRNCCHRRCGAARF